MQLVALNNDRHGVLILVRPTNGVLTFRSVLEQSEGRVLELFFARDRILETNYMGTERHSDRTENRPEFRIHRLARDFHLGERQCDREYRFAVCVWYSGI